MRRKWSDPNLESVLPGTVHYLPWLQSAQKTCCLFITKTSKLILCRERTAASEKCTQRISKLWAKFSFCFQCWNGYYSLRRVTRLCVMHTVAAKRWELLACNRNNHRHSFFMLMLLWVCNEKFLEVVFSNFVSVWPRLSQLDIRGVSWHLALERFSKICWHIPNFDKPSQQ
jgi:hypothetical protein